MLSRGDRLPEPPEFIETVPPGPIENRWNLEALSEPGVEVIRYRPLDSRQVITAARLAIPARATSVAIRERFGRWHDEDV
jgi:hypothetical protein